MSGFNCFYACLLVFVFVFIPRLSSISSGILFIYLYRIISWICPALPGKKRAFQNMNNCTVNKKATRDSMLFWCIFGTVYLYINHIRFYSQPFYRHKKISTFRNFSLAKSFGPELYIISKQALLRPISATSLSHAILPVLLFKSLLRHSKVLALHSISV